MTSSVINNPMKINLVCDQAEILHSHVTGQPHSEPTNHKHDTDIEHGLLDLHIPDWLIFSASHI